MEKLLLIMVIIFATQLVALAVWIIYPIWATRRTKYHLKRRWLFVITVLFLSYFIIIILGFFGNPWLRANHIPGPPNVTTMSYATLWMWLQGPATTLLAIIITHLVAPRWKKINESQSG
jgi:hypothetical protein